MTIYRVSCDVDDAQWFYLEDDDHHRYSELCAGGDPIRAWTPPALKAGRRDAPCSDFMAVNFSGDFVASSSAVSFLSETGTAFQVLELGHHEPLAYVRVTTVSDCLDPEACEWRGEPRKSVIFRYAIRDAALTEMGRSLFRFRQFEERRLQCGEDFRALYDASGLRGLTFTPLPRMRTT